MQEKYLEGKSKLSIWKIKLHLGQDGSHRELYNTIRQVE